MLDGINCNYYEMIKAEVPEVIDFLAYFGTEESAESY